MEPLNVMEAPLRGEDIAFKCGCKIKEPKSIVKKAAACFMATTYM
jgi:hypothetical protein